MGFEGRFANDGRRSFENLKSRAAERRVDPGFADPDDRIPTEGRAGRVANLDSRRVVIVNPADVAVEPESPGLERPRRFRHVVPNVGR